MIKKLNVTEIAERYHRTRATIWRWRETGFLNFPPPDSADSRALYWNENILEKWEQKNPDFMKRMELEEKDFKFVDCSKLEKESEVSCAISQPS